MKVDVIVPSSLSEITLGQYQKFEKFNTVENQETNFLMHKMVEIFCNMDLRNVAKIKYNSAIIIMNELNKIFEATPGLKQTFKMGTKEYGFIPKLDDMTLGEYIDLDENLGEWSTMHRAMAVLYRPIVFKQKDKYQIEEYEGIEDADKFKDMPLDVVMGSMVFFWNLSNELLQVTLNYLKREGPQQMNLAQLHNLAKSGDGFNQFTGLVKAMLPDLTL